MNKKFNTWLDTLLSEKNIDIELMFEVDGDYGTNYMSYKTVIHAIKSTSLIEQSRIKKMLIMIDFRNGDICDYLKHLAQAIAI